MTWIIVDPTHSSGLWPAQPSVFTAYSLPGLRKPLSTASKLKAPSMIPTKKPFEVFAKVVLGPQKTRLGNLRAGHSLLGAQGWPRVNALTSFRRAFTEHDTGPDCT